MAEQQGKPRIERVLPTPEPGRGGTQPRPQTNRGAPPGQDGRAGAQKPTISGFLDTLANLPKTGGDSSSSSKTGGSSGSAPKAGDNSTTSSKK